MKMSMTAISTMLSVIQKKFNQISIYEDGYAEEGESIKFGVNWGCFGTVDPDEANKFGRELQPAASTADLLNMMEIERDYRRSEILGIDKEWTEKFMEHINRTNVSALSVAVEFTELAKMNEDKLF